MLTRLLERAANAVTLTYYCVDLLQRLRAGDDSELVQRGIQLTLNAIATGLRNSG